jgi:hypothetical protein
MSRITISSARALERDLSAKKPGGFCGAFDANLKAPLAWSTRCFRSEVLVLLAGPLGFARGRLSRRVSPHPQLHMGIGSSGKIFRPLGTLEE